MLIIASLFDDDGLLGEPGLVDGGVNGGTDMIKIRAGAKGQKYNQRRRDIECGHRPAMLLQRKYGRIEGFLLQKGPHKLMLVIPNSHRCCEQFARRKYFYKG